MTQINEFLFRSTDIMPPKPDYTPIILTFHGTKQDKILSKQIFPYNKEKKVFYRINIYSQIAWEGMFHLLSEAVQIKGTKEGLIILVDPDQDHEEVKKKLLLKMESSKGFFKGAKFSFCNTTMESPAREYRKELENICKQYGLIPSEDIHWPMGQKTLRGKKTIPFTPKTLEKGIVLPLRQQTQGLNDMDPAWEQAVLIQKILRSGQKIAAPENLVLLGHVHPGAEIQAGGSVLIAGTCQGSVQAGLNNKRDAVVMALSLNPCLLKIGPYLAASDLWPKQSKSPLVAYIQQEQIQVKPYIS